MDVTSFLLGFQKGKASGGPAGDGSVPTGVYFKASEIPRPNAYYQRWFRYKGELYAFTLTYTGNGDDFLCYKWENDAWTQVFTKTKIRTTVLSCGVLYNGEIHFIGNEYKYHKVWDGGATVRDLNQLPENIYRSFVYQNRLCAYCQSTGTIYAWNESEDTWEIFAENILSSYYPQTYVINGDLYFVQNKDVYRFENGSAPKIYALSLGGKYLPRTKGNCFYYYNLGSTGQNLYKFDVVNGVETKLGGFPVAKLTFQGFTDVDTDNFTFIMGSNDGFTEFEMFEI